LERSEPTGPPRGVLLVIGAVLVIVALLVVAALAVPIQPGLPKQTPKAGIIMPSGAGLDQLNFAPSKVTVIVGVNNTVWTNDDSVEHTVKSESIPAGAAPFASGLLSTGQTFTVSLTVPGTYTYECTIHPAWMQATIIVVGASNSTESGGSGGGS